MAHFAKDTGKASGSVLFSTHADDRNQVWRVTVPHGTIFNIRLWGGDSLTVESPGSLLTFSEKKAPADNWRRFEIAGDSFGTLELHAKHSNGSVWDRLQVNVSSKVEQTLRTQAMKLLKERAISKMDFRFASLRITAARMRKMGSYLKDGEIIVRYDPSLSLGAYTRGDDTVLLPYSKISTTEQKANLCHELSHAVMDRYYPGKPLLRTVTESVGYIVQMIYLRVAKPAIKESNLKSIPFLIESFRAAGEVLASRKVSQDQQDKLRRALANSGYKNQDKKVTYNGI